MMEKTSWREIKPGDIITIFYLSRYDDWNYEVLKVEKVGRKHIYGYSVLMDDGKLVIRDWMSKFSVQDKTDVIIVRGYAEELVDALNDYYRALREWGDRQRQARREFEYQAYGLIRKWMEEWEKNNPRPENPIRSFMKQLEVVETTN